MSSSWPNKITAVDPNQNVYWGGGAKKVTGSNPFAGGISTGGSQPIYKNYEIEPNLNVGDDYYTNNPDKSKAYSKVPSLMFMA